MKKILGLLALVPSLALAANFESQSFLAVSAVYATNTLQITNLTASGSVGTNVLGTTYTNNATRIVVSAAGAGATVNLLKDVSLWARSDGSLASQLVATNIATTEVSDANVSITMTSGSGANAAVTFVIAPVPDGANASKTANWTFSFTPTASTTETVFTNVPLSTFSGVNKLRLLRIVNADTDASSQVIVTSVKLNGFVP